VASYERFAAWRRSYELVLAVYEVTDSFPRYELYGLTSQARRAAFSVVANIAEGSAKRGQREFRRFLDIAVGSITELEVALRLARDRGYLTPERWAELERLRNHAGALTWRLYSAVSRGARHAP
jgi:four helix bundle protein